MTPLASASTPALATNRPPTRAGAAFFALAFAAFGALAWAGCSDDAGRQTSYCDDVNCYACDAYGCSAVSPAPKPAGSGTGSGTGQTVAPPGSSASADGGVKACTTKAECGAGRACAGGTCQACGGADGPCPCTGASDCAGGEACVAGSCTAASNTCKFSSECGGGKVCKDSQCLAACGAATPCTTGFTCAKGACEPSPPAAGCQSDLQCGGDTPQCVAGGCAKACVAEGECGTGKYCNQGACVLDTRPQTNCTTDDQCGGTAQTQKKCLGGFCKFTCTTDPYCRSIDSRIGYCAKDGVCRTAEEAGAQCLSAADCGAGQSCVDNTCR
jgi:hypothetical protein